MKLAILTTLASVAILGSFAQADEPRGFREPPAEVKAALQACAAQVGVTFTEGQRPELTDDQKQQMRSCMEAKGMKGPGRGHREDFAKMKACLADAGVSLPERVPGQRPQFDDATRAAMAACREKIRNENDGSGVTSSSAE